MDALAAIVSLLKPQAVAAKLMHGRGRWGVRYAEFGHPSYALVLKGPCWLSVEGASGLVLGEGDFVLLPATPGFILASDPELVPEPVLPHPSGQQVDEVSHGNPAEEISASLLGGYFAFDPVNAQLLLDLLPRVLHVRASDPAIGGLAQIAGLVKREALEKRAGQSFALARLIELLLIEALRSVSAGPAASGFLAGLGDPRLAAALRGIHTRTGDPWTLAALAREAGMSRSSFAERFARVIGTTPLNYLLQWRLAVAKDLLARGNATVSEAALAVGYESASGFSTAFSRETGQSPKDFAAAARGAPA